MKNIESIDKNLKVHTSFSAKDIVGYNVLSKPFKVYGLMYSKENGFYRMPLDVAKTVNEGVFLLASNTAGGRVKFKTDSDYIAISAKMPNVGKMSHFAFTGSIGFDLYVKENGKQNYIRTYVPSVDIKTELESEFIMDKGQMREYTLNFPLYSDVSELTIFLRDNAIVEECDEYKLQKPIVYYGSSITQGACASRPGNSYQSIISRDLDCDFINLGFSGSALGEKSIAEYIAKLDMSCFVLDYDFNSTSPEHLLETHYRMYKIVRDANPDLPIVCVSKPNINDNSLYFEIDVKKRQIIIDTVNTAKSNGDKNVYFIDGGDFAKEFDAGDSITVDNCHPNDLGFMCMARVIGRLLRKILEK